MTYYKSKQILLAQLNREHLVITEALNIALRYKEATEQEQEALRSLQYKNIKMLNLVKTDIKHCLNDYSYRHFGKAFSDLPDDSSEQELIISMAEEDETKKERKNNHE